MRLGFWTLLLSHITFCIPFVVVTVYSRITGFDKNIFEAARDLGANDFMSFSRIIIPMLWPAILAGWLLSFTLSLDDVIISFFVTGPDFQILPLYIYSLVRIGLKPELNALCSVMFAISLFIVVAFQLAYLKRLINNHASRLFLYLMVLLVCSIGLYERMSLIFIIGRDYILAMY